MFYMSNNFQLSMDWFYNYIIVAAVNHGQLLWHTIGEI